MKLKQLIEQAQFLVDDAQNIVDRLKEQGGKDAIPLRAIASDISDIIHEFTRLYTDIIKRIK